MFVHTHTLCMCPTLSMHVVIIDVFQLLTLVRAVWVSSASSDSCIVLKMGVRGYLGPPPSEAR